MGKVGLTILQMGKVDDNSSNGKSWDYNSSDRKSWGDNSSDRKSWDYNSSDGKSRGDNSLYVVPEMAILHMILFLF